MSDLESKLSSAYNEIEQLSHALSDRGAQLDMERNSNMVSDSYRYLIPCSGDFSCLLITFANSLCPDQD